MPFLTFFTRHTATTAAVPERENGPDMNATGESTVAASAPVIVDAVINEKTSVELEDDSASDSSPTDPPMQSESPASDLDSQLLPPLGVLTSLSTIPSLSQVAAAMLDRKDQRAYEFSRQRAKKPADREKAREQKIKQRHAAVMGMGDPRARGRPAKMPLDAEGKPVGNGRREKVAGDDAKAGVDATTTAAMTPSARKDRELGTGARRVHEVRLEDLLRTAKIRKQKAGDFELIPHVRSVVVLDDREYDTPDIEEAWEHVSSDEDDKPVKGRSYAQVVSATVTPVKA